MGSYNNDPQQYERQRRVERYAGEFLNEPSMSAAQPLPEKPGRQTERSKRLNQTQNSVKIPPANADMQAQGWQPVQPAEWSQPQPVQPPAQPYGLARGGPAA